VPSKNILTIFGITTIFYLFYRICNSTWNFAGFTFCKKIYYADVIILITVTNLILLFRAKPNLEKNNNSLFDDQSLGENKIDELGYSSYAELLVSKIISSNFDKAFAIGINGKWGLGKTSFIDLIKRKIRQQDVIEIAFNPWNSNSPKAIVQDFFETIQKQISPFHSSAARLLVSYSNKLVALNDNTVTQSIQTSVTAITGFNSLESLFNEIDISLRQINKKIIVYIDDLDRLDKSEIVEVLRLIRNTANFYNTFFIVAYDRNYVVSALEHYNPHNKEQYLEKIFQLEVTLPHFKKDVLRYKLASKLKEKISDDYHRTIDQEIIGTTATIPSYLNIWLETIRDVTRLANSIVLNFTKLQGEVDFGEFLRLELLRIKYPSVHSLLFTMPSDFLELKSKNSSEKHRYVLSEVKIEDKLEKKLKIYLTSNYVSLSIPPNSVEKIVDYVSGIFNKDSLLKFNDNFLSVAYPSKFNRYFTYSLLDDSLSEIQFAHAMSLNQNDFNNKITEWVNNKLEVELKNRFGEIKTFDTREDFEKIITAIFHLANQKTQKPHFFSRDLVGYDGEDLYYKLYNSENKLSETYYSGSNEDLRTFILSLFQSAKRPYAFEADFIRFANNQYSKPFSLSKDDLKNLAIEYFRTYCETNEKLDNIVWSLFHDCKQTDWIEEGNGVSRKEENIPFEVKEIFKDFIINKDLDGFIFSITEPAPFDNGKYAVSNIVVALYGSWQNFKSVLDQQVGKNWKYLDEFLLFWNLFEKDGFTKYVDFKFKVIPPKKYD
jgi:hypothetical protein